jgi:hypothetical protein
MAGPTLDPTLIRLNKLEADCREATGGAIAVERSPSELARAVRRVAKLEDKEIEAIQESVRRRALAGEVPMVACAKGCWHCCAQMVAATIPEVLSIAEQIREHWTDEQKASLLDRIDEYARLTANYHANPTAVKPRPVCPLLLDAACSVWSIRPFVCRGINSTDVEACIRKRQDPINDPPVPHYVAQTFAAMYSRTGMRSALRKHGLDNQLYELMPALRIALGNPDAALRYLRGEPLFASAAVQGRDVE